MLEFFRGWKRKVGCVTLAMACLFSVAWMRSFTVLDLLMFSDTKVTSTRGAIYWEKGVAKSSPTQTRRFILTDTCYFDSAHDVSDGYQKAKITKHWRWHYFGFVTCEYDSSDYPDIRMKFWRFPYWWINIPLTLLSAWLLLSKPRAKLEPIPPQPTTDSSKN